MNILNRWMDQASIVTDCKLTLIEEIADETAAYYAYYLEMEITADKPVKIYLWFGVPHGAVHLPAVMHIHGGSQTAYLDHVKHWCEQGYVSCSYDWSGPIQERTFFSDLSSLPNKDLADTYDPINSIMLTRVLLAKKMISWLIGRPEVNAEKIGVYGISWGGSISWLLNYWDNRIAAVSPIYGCGHLTSRKLQRNHRIPFNAEDIKQWNDVLDAVALAGEQKAPLLMLSATNDFWGWMDTVCEAIVKIPLAKRSLSFAVNQNHHLDEWSCSTLTQWMDTHLRGNGVWPQMPKLEVWVDNEGRLKVQALKGNSSDINPLQVRICWSWSDFSEIQPPARHWNQSPLVDYGEEYFIPVIHIRDIVYVYADIFYPNGLKLSSLPMRISPMYLKVKESDEPLIQPIADFTHGLDGWFCSHYRTEPFHSEFNYTIIDDPDGGKALSLDEPDIPFLLSTHKLADPKWKASSLMSELYGRVYSSCSGLWRISLYYRPEQVGQQIWNYTQHSDDWKSLKISLHLFLDEFGTPLAYWDKAQKITISFQPDISNARYQAAIGNIKWIENEWNKPT